MFTIKTKYSIIVENFGFLMIFFDLSTIKKEPFSSFLIITHILNRSSTKLPVQLISLHISSTNRYVIKSEYNTPKLLGTYYLHKLIL